MPGTPVTFVFLKNIVQHQMTQITHNLSSIYMPLLYDNIYAIWLTPVFNIFNKNSVWILVFRDTLCHRTLIDHALLSTNQKKASSTGTCHRASWKRQVWFVAVSTHFKRNRYWAGMSTLFELEGWFFYMFELSSYRSWQTFRNVEIPYRTDDMDENVSARF